MASAVDSRLAYARLSAVATASRLPTANRGSNNSYTTSWDTTHVFVEDVTVAGIQEVRSTYRTTDLSRKLGRYHDDVDAVFWAWNDICLDPAFRSWNIEEYLPAIPCPALQIQGRDDQYATRAQLDAIASGLSGPVETVLLDGCAHSPHHEQPLATIEAISTFVTRLLANGGHREAP